MSPALEPEQDVAAVERWCARAAKESGGGSERLVWQTPEGIKRSRDPASVRSALAALASIAEGAPGNILEAAVEAARVRATVGEISDSLRNAFGDHKATPEVVGNVYGEAYADDPEYRMLRDRLADVAASTGSKPRIRVAKLGQDGHDRGAKIISSAFPTSASI